MKVTVTKLSEEVVRQTHPIVGRVPGWFFSCEERSNNVWRADGTDLWGHTVTTSDHIRDRALEYVFKAAEEINIQLAGGNG
jgi:hypothetical protein